jgi:hypothetical protein
MLRFYSIGRHPGLKGRQRYTRIGKDAATSAFIIGTSRGAVSSLPALDQVRRARFEATTDYGRKEIAMPATKWGRMAPATFLVTGWVVCFGLAIGAAHAQFVNPPPPPPPPTFNPSAPNTVPQAPETPVSPAPPSALPGSNSNVVLPPDTTVPSPVARSNPHAATPKTAASGAATAHGRRHAARHHRRTTLAYTHVLRPYYVSPFALGFTSPVRSCAWLEHWDGYWAPSCI